MEDPRSGMMLWLLHEHHVLPGACYRMPAGEQFLLRLFYEIIMESRKGIR